MSQTLDTVGFFARDAQTMSDVGYAMVQRNRSSPRGNKRPSKVLILEDVLDMSTAPVRRAMMLAASAARAALGERSVGYLSLSKHFFNEQETKEALAPFVEGGSLRSESDVWPAILEALGNLQGYEFWKIHGAWISENRSNIGEVIMQRIAPGEHRSERSMQQALAARAALRRSLENLLKGSTLMVLPTLPMRPPKRAAKASVAKLANFRLHSRTILALASLSGSPQLAMPVRSRAASEAAGANEASDVWEPSVSLMGRPGTDLLLLDFAVLMEKCIQEEFSKAAAAASVHGSDAPASVSGPVEPIALTVSERERKAGNEKLARGDIDGAIEHYTAAIAAEPSSPLVYSNRALAYLKLEMYEMAEMDCNRCLKLDPRSVKALLRRGCARSMLHRLSEALDDFNEVLQLEPKNRQAKEEKERIRTYVMKSAE